jgi:hypothetical protein
LTANYFALVKKREDRIQNEVARNRLVEIQDMNGEKCTVESNSSKARCKSKILSSETSSEKHQNPSLFVQHLPSAPGSAKSRQSRQDGTYPPNPPKSNA